MKIRGGTFLAAVALALLFSNAVPVFSEPATGSRDSNGNTPLHQAVLESGGLNTTKVAELLAAGADVNATNFAGQTPLHLMAASAAF